jgi:hypothetical protein
LGRSLPIGEIVTFTAPKIIASLITALWGFALALGPASPQSEQPSATIELAPYLIEASTTTSSTSSTLFIDPYGSACEQFSALAVNLGWPADQRTVIESIMFRESRCIPNAYNGKDPQGGSRGLMQLNGFWTPWLIERGLITNEKNLLQADVNLRAALEIYNYGVDRYGYGWGPWSATK